MKKLLTLGMALLLSFSTAAARAEITTWDYSVEGIFTQWTDTKGGTGTVDSNLSAIRGGDRRTFRYDYQGGVASPGIAKGYASLSWGDNSGRSSINITKQSGTVTNGEMAQGVTLTHNNKSIPASTASLAQGIAQIVLTLNPLGIPNVLPIYSTVLNFAFFETPNSGRYQDDIFVLLGSPVQPESFVYEGQEYVFSFTDSFRAIDDWYADYARKRLGLDSAAPVYGWTTKEGYTTNIATWFTINAVPPAPTPTPEPATMVLLGIGLAGLGILARRRGA